MCVAPVERVFRRNALAHVSVKINQIVERGEIGSAFAEVTHADKMQGNRFQRRIAAALAFAKAGSVDDRASLADGGEAVGDDEPRIVVRVKLKDFRLKTCAPQRAKNARDAARERYVVVGQSKPHRVANAKF